MSYVHTYIPKQFYYCPVKQFPWSFENSIFWKFKRLKHSSFYPSFITLQKSKFLSFYRCFLAATIFYFYFIEKLHYPYTFKKKKKIAKSVIHRLKIYRPEQFTIRQQYPNLNEYFAHIFSSPKNTVPEERR